MRNPDDAMLAFVSCAPDVANKDSTRDPESELRNGRQQNSAQRPDVALVSIRVTRLFAAIEEVFDSSHAAFTAFGQ